MENFLYGFEMIVWSIEDYRNNDMIDEILQIICGIAIILCALAKSYLLCVEYDEQKLYYVNENA